MHFNCQIHRTSPPLRSTSTAWVTLERRHSVTGPPQQASVIITGPSGGGNRRVLWCLVDQKPFGDTGPLRVCVYCVIQDRGSHHAGTNLSPPCSAILGAFTVVFFFLSLPPHLLIMQWGSHTLFLSPSADWFAMWGLF